MLLAFIDWRADPAAFIIPGIGWEVRWYGLAFAIGFALGLWIVSKIWKHEKLNNDWLDKLFIYVFVGTVVGARLGHCLFYEPEYYLANPVEILKIWRGGLASHGGTLGILIAIYIYSKRVTRKSMLWTLDRLVVPVGFVAALIRFANLMNSEIYGHTTTLPWGLVFERNRETLPKHPTQIYEALYYALTYLTLRFVYRKSDNRPRPFLIFGMFLIMVFLFRFCIEFIKNPQEDFEQNMMFNMGQLLSAPFIILGIISLIVTSRRKQSVPLPDNSRQHDNVAKPQLNRKPEPAKKHQKQNSIKPMKKKIIS